jgi:hypothetical protein
MGQAGSSKSKLCSETGKFLAARSAAGKNKDLMISVQRLYGKKIPSVEERSAD